MIPTVHVYADRESWLAAGEGRIGASEVYDLLLHPARFLQNRAVPMKDNDDLWRGRAMEPVIGQFYTRQTGREAVTPGDYVGRSGALVVETHADHPWAAYSPDFYADDPLVGPGVVETKSQRSRREWADTDTTVAALADLVAGVAPPKFALQCFWQLAISGRAWVDLVALLPSYDLRVIRFNADPAFQSELIERVAESRDRYLIRGELPPPDESREYAATLLRHVGPVAGKAVRRATLVEYALMTRFAAAKNAEDQSRRTASLLRNQILAVLGADYGMERDGLKVIAPLVQRESVALSELPDDVRAILAGRGLIHASTAARQVRLS